MLTLLVEGIQLTPAETTGQGQSHKTVFWTIHHKQSSEYWAIVFCAMHVQFALADCALFVLVNLAFVALFSGDIWVDDSSLIFIFGAVNICKWA